MNGRVILLAGSPSDRAHVETIAKALTEFGIEYSIRIASAHKTPRKLLEIIASYEAQNIPTVYIAAAGRSNALSGLVDAATAAPVLTCPPPSAEWSPYDLWSSIRMPSGVAPALVLDPANAALCAAKLLALSDTALRTRVIRFQEKNAQRILEEDEAIRS